MELAPDDSFRVVFAGPINVMRGKLSAQTKLNAHSILDAARHLELRGLLTIRSRANDHSAQSIFDLAGTSQSLFPLGLIGAFELPTEPVRASLSPFIDKEYLGADSPFAACEVAAVVLRVFENGYGAITLTLEFINRPGLAAGTLSKYVSEHFAYQSSKSVALRQGSLQVLNDLVPTVLGKLIVPRKKSHWDGQIRFLSTMFVMSAAWSETLPHALRLPLSLRRILQPEAADDLTNQSNSDEEYIAFTSGFHIYVWNRNANPDFVQRIISLASFLNLMNILYFQIDDIKNELVEVLGKGKIPLLAPTDIDERLEVIYNQVMVSSASWRRDFSSFRDEIDRRWRLGELKQYCFSLIQTLEARSARKRTLAIGILLALISAAQLVSIVADGFQLSDRFSSSTVVREDLRADH